MKSVVLETQALTKFYRKTAVLEQVNLRLEQGKIYGFVGQNGAGKTTFLRLITGLAFPSSGKLALWGESATEKLQEQRKRIGSMIESPALFPNLTAWQNLEVQRILRGVPDKESIDRTLKLVGLEKSQKKVRNFSLGMKQRLGISISLLGNPDLVILDEPTNGLDPVGIQELRDLIKRLNDSGVTVLVSSHNLAEIQHIASYVGIIINGKLKYEGKVNSNSNLEDIFMSVTREEEYSYV